MQGEDDPTNSERVGRIVRQAEASREALARGESSHPETVRRECTDLPWLVMFLVALAFLAAALFVAGGRGHAWQAVVFYDSAGLACGVDHVDKPLVFVCRNASGNATLADGPEEMGPFYHAPTVCVERCPNASNTESVCNASGGLLTYPSAAKANLICAAQDKQLLGWQARWASRNVFSSVLQHVFFMIQVWKPMLLCVVVAIVAANLYVAMLGICASTLVYVGLFLLSVVPLGFGAWMLKGGWDSFDVVVGSVLVLTGVSFMGIACCAGYNMDKATCLLELSCKCFIGTPLLLVGPVLVLVLRYGLFFLLLRGALEIYSMGSYNHSTMLFSPNLTLYLVMGFAAFMLLWINNTIDCCWDFCLALFTEVWYFNGGVHDRWRPSCLAMLQIPYIMMRYHMGTMIQGGLIVGFFKPLRFLVGTLTAPSRLKSGIPIVTCLSDSCCCCLNELYLDRMELLSRNYIMETAISGSSFWPALRESLEVMRTDDGTLRLLNGATWFFQVAGFGLVVLTGALLTLLVEQSFPEELAGPMGGVFTAKIDIACFNWLCQVLCFLSAMPYIMGFDTVSDTILYCHLVVKRRAKASPETGYLAELSEYLWDLFGAAAASCVGYREHSEASLEAQGRRLRGIQLPSDSSDSSEDGCSDGEQLAAPQPQPPVQQQPLLPRPALLPAQAPQRLILAPGRPPLLLQQHQYRQVLPLVLPPVQTTTVRLRPVAAAPQPAAPAAPRPVESWPPLGKRPEAEAPGAACTLPVPA